MHCRAHQRGDTTVIRDNAMADMVAKRAAKEEHLPEAECTLIPHIETPPSPKYTKEELKLVEELGGTKQQGYYALPSSQVFLPASVTPEVVK